MASSLDIFKASYMTGVSHGNGRVSCKWYSVFEGEPGAVPAGVFPTFTSASYDQICMWMTGERYISYQGHKCLWSKGYIPTQGADGVYR